MSRKRKGPPKGPAPEGGIPIKEPQARREYNSKTKPCQERRRKKTEEDSQRVPKYWAVLPPEIRYNPDLPPLARLLYAEISALTDLTGYCYASNAYFQRLFKISERTLQNHLQALKTSGCIRIESGDGGHGRRRIYAGINPLVKNPAENCGVPTNPAENCGVTPQKIAGSTLEEQKNISSPPIVPQGGRRARKQKETKEAPDWKPDRFQGFWDFYPKSAHKSKQAAIRSWDRLKPSDELIAEIGKALKRQKETDEWQRGVGIPYPSTYLNNRRWTDEIADGDADGGEPERRLAGERC